MRNVGIGQHPEIVVEVPNTIGAGPGDAVRLAIESGNVLRAAVVVYVVPLLVAILGFLLASYLAGPAGFPAYREALGIAGAAVGLILSFVWVASYDRRAGDRFMPKMLEVVNRASGEQPAEPPQC